MRKRNNRIQVRLDSKELQKFEKLVKKSGISRETYLRQLINGVVPRDAPPPDYYAMMTALYKVGNNLNQIAQKAHALNFVDAGQYDIAVREYRKFVADIRKAVILPEEQEA